MPDENDQSRVESQCSVDHGDLPRPITGPSVTLSAGRNYRIAFFKGDAFQWYRAQGRDYPIPVSSMPTTELQRYWFDRDVQEYVARYFTAADYAKVEQLTKAMNAFS